jgi:molybdopterin converting factor small subunit
MRVVLPSPLFPYTSGEREVEAQGDSIDRVLTELDTRYPGIRHRVVDEQGRIRPHIRFFVNGQAVRSLDCSLQQRDEVMIVAALSGG